MNRGHQTGQSPAAIYSELTCNASISDRKRNRKETMVTTSLFPLQIIPYSAPTMVNIVAEAVASTSGRPVNGFSGEFVSLESPHAQEILAQIYQENHEIDTFICLESEKLRLVMEETRRRHFHALLSSLEQRVGKKLREKEAELEKALQRNAELEEKVRQMTAENRIWFNLAKNNEAVVSSLRISLQQLLVQNNAFPVAESYGDSDGAPQPPADDAQSCCFAGDNELRCKVCQKNGTCVLVLPCRHLCLCKGCETTVDTCPICHSAISGCLQIFVL